MNLAASLRPQYASIEAAFTEFPSSKLDYAQDEQLRAAAIDHWTTPIVGPALLPSDVDWFFRVDAVSSFGRLWTIVPTWLLPDLSPRAVCLRCPCQTTWPKHMRVSLDAGESAHMNDQRACQLGIGRYLIRALSLWKQRTPDFDAQWQEQPLGATILLHAVAETPELCEFSFFSDVDDWFVGQTATELQELWQVKDMPETMALSDLRLIRHFNQNTSLVSLPDSDEQMVLKHDVYHYGIYHEIKLLLMMEPHINIIGRPNRIVTVGEHGPAQDMVCGMLIDYLEGGDLEKTLPLLSCECRLNGWSEESWYAMVSGFAIDVTQALLHVAQQDLYCSDLRMDNIVLNNINGEVRAVLIDFQMDRNIFAWSPPEMLALEWVKDIVESKVISDKDKEQYRRRWQQFLSDRKIDIVPSMPKDRYDNAKYGWWAPWVLSTRSEREQGMVYLLGKVLWCLFEGQGSIGNILGRSHVHEPELEFGEFKRTPKKIEDLIRHMTAGSREWKKMPMGLYRRGALLLPRDGNGLGKHPIADFAACERQRTETWKLQTWSIKQSLEHRAVYHAGRANPFQVKALGHLFRPKLQEVLDTLEDYRGSL